MSYHRQPPEFREVFKRIAKKYDLSVEETYLIWRAVWTTVFNTMNSNAPMDKIIVRGLGIFVPYKKWKERFSRYDKDPEIKKQIDELIRD
jgi:hypothetical protein